MGMTDTDFENVAPIVARVSTRLSYDWPGITADDIAQEICLYIAENWDSIVRNCEDETQVKRFVRTLSERKGTAFCASERYVFQHYSAEWIYTPKEIRRILPDFFDGFAFLDAPKRPEGGRQTLEGDGLSIAAMDVRAAYEQLNEQEQVYLARAYRDHEPQKTSRDKMRVSRAVDRMVAILNRGVLDRFNHSDHDGPGAREAMSNASARYATGNNY